MTTRTIDDLGTDASVVWALAQEEIEPTFLAEVSTVSSLTERAIVDPMLSSAVDELFGIQRNPSWALFQRFKNYFQRVKRLFRKKVAGSLSVREAIEVLDSLDEEASSSEEGEKLYTLLNTLGELDQMLDEITFSILSAIKP